MICEDRLPNDRGTPRDCNAVCQKIGRLFYAQSLVELVLHSSHLMLLSLFLYRTVLQASLGTEKTASCHLTPRA